MSHQSLTKDSASCLEPANAKLNLGLKVLSRRQDGFHDLLGVFQTVSLGDTVRVTLEAEITLDCSDPALPAGPQNLAWRAADLYRSQTGTSGCHIELTKRIPAGAGLGGGSADAAAVLRGLDRLSDRPLGLSRLVELGAHLGSDVPFAVGGGTSLVEGRGERLLPLTWATPPGWWCVLVCPPEPVPTAWAYAELARRRPHGVLSNPSSYATLIGSARGGCLHADRLWPVLENDFQPLVEDTKPIVARASQLLADTDPLAQSMSGSGSTVYGIYDDRNAARRAETILRGTEYPVFLCTPVPGLIDAVGQGEADNE
ncbi:MAG TPA: 4-(cytidine 5'-diphospho)-2-C-methyl-D-erythritol kinase [Candidatus Latescibacteria bacterium]|nr:4-(cytidine 5'-diphospho)-2-C-methyl-D-erythritol kinase [Candidatus Latescibacterota bacterium]HJP33415.1 4-(cytidine 5'-diphospho)-2-C-methyl-D-erythritol kinase [Candidatus Latescibacterota bacterium]